MQPGWLCSFFGKWGKDSSAPQGQRGARGSSEPWQQEQGQAATPWLPRVIKQDCGPVGWELGIRLFLRGVQPNVER